MLFEKQEFPRRSFYHFHIKSSGAAKGSRWWGFVKKEKYMIKRQPFDCCLFLCCCKAPGRCQYFLITCFYWTLSYFAAFDVKSSSRVLCFCLNCRPSSVKKFLPRNSCRKQNSFFALCRQVCLDEMTQFLLHNRIRPVRCNVPEAGKRPTGIEIFLPSVCIRACRQNLANSQ